MSLVSEKCIRILMEIFSLLEEITLSMILRKENIKRDLIWMIKKFIRKTNLEEKSILLMKSIRQP